MVLRVRRIGCSSSEMEKYLGIFLIFFLWNSDILKAGDLSRHVKDYANDLVKSEVNILRSSSNMRIRRGKIFESVLLCFYAQVY